MNRIPSLIFVISCLPYFIVSDHENDGAWCGGYTEFFCISNYVKKYCPRKCKAYINDGSWSHWSEWGTCDTSSCDQIRTRECNDPPPKNNGNDCPGLPEEKQSCDPQQCSVDGQWGDWTQFSQCSPSCLASDDADSYKARVRFCDGPSPQPGGKDCVVDAADTAAGISTATVDSKQRQTEAVGCTGISRCPVDGQWAQWKPFSECSPSCLDSDDEDSYKARVRFCDGPSPQYGGKDCVVDAADTAAGISTETVDSKQRQTETEACTGISRCPENCTLDNGGCEYICNQSSNGVRCQCSDGKDLKDDGKSCDWRNYFYVGSEDSLRISNGVITHDIDVIGTVTSVAFDYSSNTLFFATNHNGEYSINAFHPKTMTARTILDKTELSQKVTEMIYSSADQAIYFATADGQVCMLQNIFGKEATVVPIHKFSSVSGMGGSACHGGTMFVVVDSKDGMIYRSAINFQPIVTGLTHPRGLAIDYVHQLLYWSSDTGIEEAKYDGSCQRPVATSMGGRRPFSMVFTDTLYWTDERVHNGSYSVMKTDISSGRHTEVSHSDKKLYGITYIYPEDSWQLVERREQVNSTIEGHQVPVPVLGKEFKIKFSFIADSSRHAMRIGDIGNISYTEPGLTVFFDIDGNVESTTIPLTVNGSYSIGITQEREGGHYRFHVKSNNNVVHTVINNGAKVHNDENIWMFDMTEPMVYDSFEVHKKVSSESCSALTTGCPVDCVMGEWGEWETDDKCTATCGDDGTVKRVRSIATPAEFNGKECTEPTEDTRSCNGKPCPVDGGYTEWTAWGDCESAATCGRGYSYRTRCCTNPEPTHGGKTCVDVDNGLGLPIEIRACFLAPCPLNGGWTLWSNYDQCSENCGGGTRTRSRACEWPAPHFNGDSCGGKSSEEESCNTEDCPIDGKWTDWTQYSECTGYSKKFRHRCCTDPAPAHNGADCPGDSWEDSDCSPPP